MDDHGQIEVDVVTTTVVKEGVLEAIVDYAGEAEAFYTYEEGNPYVFIQEWAHHGISTTLRVRFNDSPEEEADLLFPLHIYYPLSVMPEGGWRFRYTFSCTEPATQAKLDAYAAAGAGFGTYDECLPAVTSDIVDKLYAALSGEEFVGAMLAIGTNRKCRLTFEFLRDLRNGKASRTYRFKASDWERDVWEEYKDRIA